MKNHNHHLGSFFEFASQVDTHNEHNYNVGIRIERKKIEKHRHLVDSDTYADMCFTHFLFMVMICKNNTLAEKKLDECMRVYKKTKNHRYASCYQYKKKRNDLMPVKLNTAHVDFNIPNLLRFAPGIAGLAQLGIESVNKHNEMKTIILPSLSV
jgi:hypothetical protein